MEIMTFYGSKSTGVFLFYDLAYVKGTHVWNLVLLSQSEHHDVFWKIWFVTNTHDSVYHNTGVCICFVTVSSDDSYLRSRKLNDLGKHDLVLQPCIGDEKPVWSWFFTSTSMKSSDGKTHTQNWSMGCLWLV